MEASTFKSMSKMHERLFRRLIFRSTRLRSSVETSHQLENYTKPVSDITDTIIMVYKIIKVNTKKRQFML